jgi:hypothetical protein
MFFLVNLVVVQQVRPFHANLVSASFGRRGFNTKEMRDKLTALWSARSKNLQLPKVLQIAALILFMILIVLFYGIVDVLDSHRQQPQRTRIV